MVQPTQCTLARSAALANFGLEVGTKHTFERQTAHSVGRKRRRFRCAVRQTPDLDARPEYLRHKAARGELTVTACGQMVPCTFRVARDCPTEWGRVWERRKYHLRKVGERGVVGGMPRKAPQGPSRNNILGRLNPPYWRTLPGRLDRGISSATLTRRRTIKFNHSPASCATVLA